MVGGLSAGVGRNTHHSNQRNVHHSNQSGGACLVARAALGRAVAHFVSALVMEFVRY